MPTLFSISDDAEDTVDCPKCDAVLRTQEQLKKHDTAVHGQSLTDAEGRCKMCADHVEEAGRHLREECDPQAGVDSTRSNSQ